MKSLLQMELRREQMTIQPITFNTVSNYYEHFSKQMEEVSNLPKEMFNQQMKLNEKLIKTNVASKVFGLGQNFDAYA